MPRIAPRDSLIVEGAGGVLVPINRTQLMIDLMSHLKLPVLLVSRTSLGTINHSLLSVAALRSARLDIRGVVLVGIENRENRNAIEHYGKVRVVGFVPLLEDLDRECAAESVSQDILTEGFTGSMNSALRIWHPFTQEALIHPRFGSARAEGAYLYTVDGAG